MNRLSDTVRPLMASLAGVAGADAFNDKAALPEARDSCPHESLSIVDRHDTIIPFPGAATRGLRWHALCVVNGSRLAEQQLEEIGEEITRLGDSAEELSLRVLDMEAIMTLLAGIDTKVKRVSELASRMAQAVR